MRHDNKDVTKETSEGRVGQILPSDVREGSVVEREAVTIYAGFWKRAAAYLLDTIVITTSAAVFAVGGKIFFNTKFDTVFLFSSFMLGWLYYALNECSNEGATFGKQALRIRVVDLSGQRVSFGRATARCFAKIASGITFCVGYAMAGWTAHRQTLHDMAAGCLVVNDDAVNTVAHRQAPSLKSWQIALIVIVALFVPVIGILSAIAMPSYQGYVERTRLRGSQISVMEWIAQAQPSVDGIIVESL